MLFRRFGYLVLVILFLSGCICHSYFLCGVSNLTKLYKRRFKYSTSSWFNVWPWVKQREEQVVPSSSFRAEEVAYGDGDTPALCNITISFPTYTPFVVLVGASGSGKSTLAKCFAGVEPASAGLFHFTPWNRPSERDVTTTTVDMTTRGDNNHTDANAMNRSGGHNNRQGDLGSSTIYTPPVVQLFEGPLPQPTRGMSLAVPHYRVCATSESCAGLLRGCYLDRLFRLTYDERCTVGQVLQLQSPTVVSGLDGELWIALRMLGLSAERPVCELLRSQLLSFEVILAVSRIWRQWQQQGHSSEQEGIFKGGKKEEGLGESKAERLEVGKWSRETREVEEGLEVGTVVVLDEYLDKEAPQVCENFLANMHLLVGASAPPAPHRHRPSEPPDCNLNRDPLPLLRMLRLQFFCVTHSRGVYDRSVRAAGAGAGAEAYVVAMRRGQVYAAGPPARVLLPSEIAWLL